MNHLWENVLAQFQLLMTCYQSFVGSNFVVSFNINLQLPALMVWKIQICLDLKKTDRYKGY